MWYKRWRRASKQQIWKEKHKREILHIFIINKPTSQAKAMGKCFIFFPIFEKVFHLIDGLGFFGFFVLVLELWIR